MLFKGSPSGLGLQVLFSRHPSGVLSTMTNYNVVGIENDWYLESLNADRDLTFCKLHLCLLLFMRAQTVYIKFIIE